MKPWNLVFLVCFITYFAIRAVFAHRTKANVKALSHVDSLDRVLLVSVLVASLLLPVLYLFTPLLSFADYRLPRYVPWIGAALMPAALYFFYRAHADLGANWSVTLEIRQGHELVNRGVYRRIRHPMYAAIFLFSIAQGLLLENWLAGWAALVSFTLLYLVRAPREERMMLDFFAEPYRDYMRRTGRLFPRFSTPPAA
jgi:protein-S-isoprenylcysteine O-methyltransferase Ste14